MRNGNKMNNYSKFYCKTFIVKTAIMSDKREWQGYAVFYLEVFCRLANQKRGHIRVMLESRIPLSYDHQVSRSHCSCKNIVFASSHI